MSEENANAELIKEQQYEYRRNVRTLRDQLAAAKKFLEEKRVTAHATHRDSDIGIWQIAQRKAKQAQEALDRAVKQMPMLSSLIAPVQREIDGLRDKVTRGAASNHDRLHLAELENSLEALQTIAATSQQ